MAEHGQTSGFGDSKFGEEEENRRLTSLESRLRSLPLRSPSENLDARIELQLATMVSTAMNAGTGHCESSNGYTDQTASQNSASHRESRRNGENELVPVSLSAKSGDVGQRPEGSRRDASRRGSLLLTTWLSSLAVILFVVAATSRRTDNGSENGTTTADANGVASESAVSLESLDAFGKDAELHQVTEPSRTTFPARTFGALSSQIVEDQLFAKVRAVDWEQQHGATFPLVSHFRDQRFSECRSCHQRLSSPWHNESDRRQDVTLCQDCHQLGG